MICFFSKETDCPECDIQKVDCCFHCPKRFECSLTCLIYEGLKNKEGILIPKGFK